MAAGEASSSFEAKTSLFCAILALVLHDKTPNRWKNQAMEKYRDFLKKHCRLYGKNLKRSGRDHRKKLFEAVLREKVHVNLAK